MRIEMIVIAPCVVIGCSSGPEPTPSPPPVQVGCTRVLPTKDVAAAARFKRITVLDDTTVVGLVDNGGTLAGDAGTGGGIVGYDLARDYAERDAPLFSYSVAASEILARPDKRMLVLVESDGVATLDVDTGCLRVVPVTPVFAGDTPLAAFDPTGRVFLVDHQDLVSVNLETLAVTRGGRVADAAHYTEVEFNSISNDVLFWGDPTALSATFDANTLLERPVELLTDEP